MPVFDQGYQRWTGRLAGHGGRWWPITRQGIRAQLRNRKTKYIVVAAWTPALALAAALAIWGLIEQKSKVIEPLMLMLPGPLRLAPREFRGSVWTIAFDLFLRFEIFTALVVVLLVGPDLVSQDLRYNAMPLYLSRPMRRRDYFLGKLGVIVGFLLMVAVGPSILAYVVGVAFSLDLSVVRDTWRALAGSVGFGLVVAVVCGLVMLAFSSLSRNSRAVAMLWIALWILTLAVAAALVESGRDPYGSGRRAGDGRWWVVSFGANLDRLREAALDAPAAYRQFTDRLRTAVSAAGEVALDRGPFRLGRRRPRDPDSFGHDFEDGPDRDVPAAAPTLPFEPPYPWTWAAGVMTGLSLLSVVILSTRVRSLDRLR